MTNNMLRFAEKISAESSNNSDERLATSGGGVDSAKSKEQRDLAVVDLTKAFHELDERVQYATKKCEEYAMETVALRKHVGCCPPSCFYF